MYSALTARVACIAGLVLALTGVAALLPRAIGPDDSDSRPTGTQGFVQPASAETLTAQLAALGNHLEEQPKDAGG